MYNVLNLKADLTCNTICKVWKKVPFKSGFAVVRLDLLPGATHDFFVVTS